MHLSISGEDFRTFISESFFSSAVPFCGTHSHRGRFSGHDNLNLLQSRVKAYLSPIFTIFCTRYQVVFHLYHTYHLLLLISLLPSNMSSSIVLHWVNSSITNNFCVTRTVITYYISHLTPLNSCPAWHSYISFWHNTITFLPYITYTFLSWYSTVTFQVHLTQLHFFPT